MGICVGEMEGKEQSGRVDSEQAFKLCPLTM